MATMLKLPAANCAILPPQQQKRAFLAGAATTRLDAATVFTARRQTLSSSSSSAAATAKVMSVSAVPGQSVELEQSPSKNKIDIPIMVMLSLSCSSLLCDFKSIAFLEMSINCRRTPSTYDNLHDWNFDNSNQNSQHSSYVSDNSMNLSSFCPKGKWM